MKQNKYETIVVFDVSKSEEEINELFEKISSLISQNGTVDSVDKWGKRRLAYEIEKKREGYYILIDFTANTDFIKKLEHVYNITDGILRTIVVKKGA